MTNEELNHAVYDKCDREYDTFLDEINQAFKDKTNGRNGFEHGDDFLSEYAYQYTIYGDILTALEDMELSDEQCKALLESPNPLYSIYDEWLDTETSHMDGIRDSVISNAEKEMEALKRNLEDSEKSNEMTVVCVEPGKPAYEKTISTGLKSLQNEVGGDIEATYPWEDYAAIISNDESKIIGLPLNRSLSDDKGNMYDVIAGSFIIAGLGEEDFCSLTPEQVEKYTEMFKTTETIFLMDGEIKAFPSDDVSQVPVYLQSAEYAYKHNELDAYRLSYQTNIDCKYDIQKALADNYSDNRLNTESVWKQVTEKYGKERVTALLAQTCKELSGDGRISTENKKWTSSIQTPDDKFIIEKPHIGLVDLLVSKARKETAKEKTSVLEKLESAKAKVAPPVPKTDRKKEQVL